MLASEGSHLVVVTQGEVRPAVRGGGRRRSSPARHDGLPRARHSVKGTATHHERVELGEACGEIDLWIRDDPIGLAVWAGSIAVQPDRARVAPPPHSLLLAA